MTTRTEVAADSPLIYYYLDESTGNPTNYGSSGGTGTATGTITRSQTGAGTATGTSWRINPASVATNISKASVTSGTAWTFETWVKRGTAGSDWVRILANLRASADPNNYWEVAIVDESPTGTLRLYDSVGGSATFQLGALSDLNWHHIAVTYSSGTVKLYADGVLLNSTSMTVASRSGTFYVGDTRVVGRDSYVDEPAFFTTALSDARIAAHAGRVAIKVTAPAISIPFTSPAVNVTAIDINNQTYVANADRGEAGGTEGTESTAAQISINNSTTGQKYALFNFTPASVSSDKVVSSATFKVYNNASQAGAGRVRRATAPWTEAGTEVVSSSATNEVIFTIQPGLNTLDVTGIANDWANGAANYGLIVIADNDGYARTSLLATREAATVANRPTLNTVLADRPKIPAIISAPVMAMTLNTPQHRSQTGNRLAAPAAVFSLSAPDAVVRVSGSIAVQAPAMSVSLAFVGGQSRNPDQRVRATVIENYITTGNPTVGVSYPMIISAPAMSVSLTTPNALVSLKTNKIIQAPAMTLKAELVGVYFKEGDRYLKIIPSTVDADDVWMQMDETAGAPKALDYIKDSETSWNNPGVYKGNPVFKTVGPQLRPAVRFDGIDDYLQMGAYNRNNKYLYESSLTVDRTDNTISTEMSVTVEMSFKTTSLNGVVFSGTGGTSSTAARASATGTDAPYVSGNELRIIDGELVIRTAGAKDLRVRKFVADGEWHHIVFAVPSEVQMRGGYPYTDAAKPAYLMVDGAPTFVRYGSFGPNGYGGTWIPYSFMAKATPIGVPSDQYGYPLKAEDFLGGELRDVVIRMNYYVERSTATKIYYEWSNSLLVQPPAMTVNLRTVAPTKARGNRKRMLAVYGLPTSTITPTFGASRPQFNYMAVMAGFVIRNRGNFVRANDQGYFATDYVFPVHPYLTGSSAVESVYYPEPLPFELDDYMVYPVSITGEARTKSVPGTINYEYLDSAQSDYIDNETGLSRFIDLQKDLIERPESYDVITVAQYPWQQPEAPRRLQAPITMGSGTRIPRTGIVDFSYQQPRMGLTDTQWAAARDRFRDSLRAALYAGASLWISEVHMAHHLGFVQGYDVHGFGDWRETDGPNQGQYGVNYAGWEIDKAHFQNGFIPTGWVPGQQGDYRASLQANIFRRVVATEQGLTDIPSWMQGDSINAKFYDNFNVIRSRIAFDIANKPFLVVGDRVQMSLDLDDPSDARTYYKKGIDHLEILSARPDGIVGKVITREQEWFYGPNGIRVDNIYKNNAVTIVAERGTVLAGRPIGGRVFMEFMDTDTETTHLFEDTNKEMWNGDATPGSQLSSWSFDEGRQKRILIISITNKLRYDSTSGSYTQVAFESRYLDYQAGPVTFRAHYSMNRRGLKWLAGASDLAPGQAKVVAPVMEVTLSTPAPTFTRTRQVTNKVVGAMRFDLELRNFGSNPSVRNKALPMVMDLSLLGLGKKVSVPAMTLSLTTGEAAVLVATELIAVYIDGGTTFTTYLKENN